MNTVRSLVPGLKGRCTCREDVDFQEASVKELYPTFDLLLRRSMVNVDKPRGPSSHEVAAWVSRLLNQKKVGHGGTLERKLEKSLCERRTYHNP
jgi:hypothetical protein